MIWYGPGQADAKRASFTDFAGQRDFPAEQPTKLTHNGKTQSRAAVMPGQAALRLAEFLEDQSLILWRDADAVVNKLERHKHRGPDDCVHVVAELHL